MDTCVLYPQGLACNLCDRVVNFALKEIPGVFCVESNYLRNSVRVSYDASIVTQNDLCNKLDSIGYPTSLSPQGNSTLLLFGSIVFVILFLVRVVGLPMAPRAEAGASLAEYFALGVLSSIHCIAMCGGIMISQSIGKLEHAASRNYGSPNAHWLLADALPAAAYNGSRLCSYMILGALCGAVGGALVYEDHLKGLLLGAAGALVCVMGLRMVGIIPNRKGSRSAAMAASALSRVCQTHKLSHTARSALVGVAGGLMPCGILLSMEFCAASTFSALEGSLVMGSFCLGTMPLMLLFGAVGAILPPRWLKSLIVVGAACMAAFGINLIISGAMGLFV